jgi:hypothetical protein
MNTARSGAYGAGTYTAALMFSSDATPAASDQFTERWNGTTWTEVGDLVNDISKSTGFGATYDAAIRCGGGNPPGAGYSAVSETWNGTSWTEGSDINQAREQLGSVSGSVTAGLIFGGQGPPAAMQTVTEQYNGSTWTETGDLNTGRYFVVGSGSTTAGLAFGGNLDPGNTDVTESFNGSSWTERSDLNTARHGLIGFGTISATLATGGGDPLKANTEDWNGNTWAEVADLNTARKHLSRASAGTTTNGLVYVGDISGTKTAGSEEWSGSTTAIKTVDTD